MSGSTGVSLFLIAVGAILYFAVTNVVDGLNIGVVGVILMVVGAIGLVFSSIALGMSRTRVERRTVVQNAQPVQAGTSVTHEDVR